MTVKMKAVLRIIGIAVALAAFPAVVYLVGATGRAHLRTIERADVLEQRASCFGAGQRVVIEIDQIYWPLYQSNAITARAKATPPSQRVIRSHEARSVYAGILAIAADRVDVSFADKIPHAPQPFTAQAEAIRLTILHAGAQHHGFSCVHAYPLP